MRNFLNVPVTVTVLLFSLIIFATSCQREVEGTLDVGGTTEVAVNDNIMVTGGITGIVVDENNQPVPNATVKSGTNTTTTDRYGSFRFRNISLSKANGAVKVEKTGFFTGFRTFVSVDGRINNIRIKLIPKSISGNFTASSGGTVTNSSGGKLVIPANAITDAGGNTYTGVVNVVMAWIDPSSADLPYTLMGDLRGITTSGAERGLSTYGMIGVELTDATGQALKILTGKTAELTFPIPSSLQGTAPATIDLWHFDEATVRWKQEGTATKTGNNYIAQVSHFSFWNCDAPFPLIDLCMSFKDGEGQPLINAQVRIKRVVTNTYGYGRTDSVGNLCGKVPKNEALVLEVMDQCNTPIYSQNIGPFAGNSTLPVVTVTIPAANSLIISGLITNCTGGNVTNGAATIYISNSNYYVVPVNNGAVSLNILRCSNSTINFSIIGTDYATVQQSNPVSGSGTSGTVNVGTIQACGTSSSQFIEILIDGVPYNFASPPDTFNYIDSVSFGTYSNLTNFYVFRQGGSGTTSYSNVSFANNQAVGIVPLNNCNITLGNTNFSNQIITPNPVVNLTAFGTAPGGFVEGNFNVQMMFGATPKNVVYTFRVRR
ncbi:MAG: carboxypeptidase-like regulatory domain-containing protein [Chitinophagaceae bacterium]